MLDLITLEVHLRAERAERNQIPDNVFEDLGLSLEEHGELAKAIREHEGHLPLHTNSMHHDIPDELADCIIADLNIASDLGINIETAITKKMQENNSKTYVSREDLKQHVVTHLAVTAVKLGCLVNRSSSSYYNQIMQMVDNLTPNGFCLCPCSVNVPGFPKQYCPCKEWVQNVKSGKAKRGDKCHCELFIKL